MTAVQERPVCMVPACTNAAAGVYQVPETQALSELVGQGGEVALCEAHAEVFGVSKLRDLP